MGGTQLERMAKFSGHGSWAVWGPLDRDVNEPFTRASDIRFPPVSGAELEPLLTRRAVLVGLNPGDAFDPSRGAWVNWHYGPRSNDHLIAEALRGTTLWGSYMTDLIQTIESDSSLISDSMVEDPEIAAAAVRRLTRELCELGADGPPPALVCFGALVHETLMSQADLIEQETAIAPDRIVRILHYSGSASAYHRSDPARYRQLVHAALTAAGVLDDQGDRP